MSHLIFQSLLLTLGYQNQNQFSILAHLRFKQEQQRLYIKLRFKWKYSSLGTGSRPSFSRRTFAQIHISILF